MVSPGRLDVAGTKCGCIALMASASKAFPMATIAPIASVLREWRSKLSMAERNQVCWPAAAFANVLVSTHASLAHAAALGAHACQSWWSNGDCNRARTAQIIT